MGDIYMQEISYNGRSTSLLCVHKIYAKTYSNYNLGKSLHAAPRAICGITYNRLILFNTRIGHNTMSQ